MDLTLGQPRTPYILLHVIIFAVATVSLYTRAMEEKSREAARHHALAMVGQFIDAWLAQLSHPFRKLVSAAADLDSYVIHAPALGEPEYSLNESAIESLHLAAEDIRAGTDRIGEQLVHLSQWSILAESQSPDFALPELEKVEFTPLNPVVAAVMDRLRVHIGDSSIIIGTHLAALDIRVPLSRIEIEQVVENLVLNAWHACSAKQSRENTLDLRTFINKAGDTINLEVEDSGVGILPENIDNVFEPFFTSRETRGGTGLGLPIIRTLARNAGGDSQVIFSEPGRTIVRVSLPFEHG
jgi:signal transduction histidine kinase